MDFERYRFPSRKREAIRNRFLAESDFPSAVPKCQWRFPHWQAERARQAELFVKIIEGIVSAHRHLVGMSPDKQQVRQRNLKSLASALAKLDESVKKLDNDAKAFVVYLAHTESSGRPEADKVSPLEYLGRAKELAGRLTGGVSAFNLAAQRAVKELPVHTFNCRLQTALAVERQFYDFSLNYAEHVKGFAALCLAAIFDGAGENVVRVDYWLRKARRSDESMTALINRNRT